MNWNTIYIIGIDDFWEDVNKRLLHSDLNFLPGHIEKMPDKKFQGLYWLDSQVDLRQFKETVGGKLIWKYRLHFFSEIVSTNATQNKPVSHISFSAKEDSMIKAMRSKKQLELSP